MVRQTAVSLTTPGESSVTFGGSNHTETLYTTSFEDFAAGEFIIESGWDSEFGSTAITDESPANGAQHLKLTPQDFGGVYRVRAFSPLTERAANLNLAPQQLYTIALQTKDNRVVQRVMVE